MKRISLKNTSADRRGYMLASRTDNWATPQKFFNTLDNEFQFTLDAAASAGNAKCAYYFNRRQNGLLQDWGTHSVFLNPPYGRCIAEWAEKSLDAARRGATVVMLLPARTDTAWYHDIGLLPETEVRFVRGRVKFGGSKYAAPFPSMVLVLRPRHRRNVRRKFLSIRAA